MKVKTDINPASILKARGLGKSTKARVYLANQVAKLSDPYVPLQTGTLKNSRRISGDGSTITYPGPYAHYQYVGKVMGGRAPKQYTGEDINYHGGPMRGREWDKRMLADRKDDLIKGFAKYTGGKPK